MGLSVPPTAAAAATAEPEIEPNIILASTLTCPNDPGTRPTITCARLMRRIAIPPLFIRVPAKIKKGIASSAKLSSPFARR